LRIARRAQANLLTADSDATEWVVCTADKTTGAAD